jgi:hypothetical protein
MKPTATRRILAVLLAVTVDHPIVDVESVSNRFSGCDYSGVTRWIVRVPTTKALQEIMKVRISFLDPTMTHRRCGTEYAFMRGLSLLERQRVACR